MGEIAYIIAIIIFVCTVHIAASSCLQPAGPCCAKVNNLRLNAFRLYQGSLMRRCLYASKHSWLV
jgi:hypothetical protein